MYCPHFTIVVCAIGVLLATVGASKYDEFIETELSMKAYSDSGLQKRSVGEHMKVLEKVEVGKHVTENNEVEAQKTKREAKKKPKFRVRRLPPLKLNEVQTYGVAQISFEKEGVICSGVHLKPWIILTTAECVEKRDIEKVSAIVMYTEGNLVNRVQVEVKEINKHANYTKEKPQNNLAVVIIYGDTDWNVGEFLLPPQNFTTDVIIKYKMTTYVDQWIPKGPFDFIPITVTVPVTDKYTLCGALGDFTNTPWYCVDRTNYPHIYNKIDLGSPLFFKNKDQSYLLGLYTGLQLHKSLSGYMYCSTYLNIDWIYDQVHQHPVPPK